MSDLAQLLHQLGYPELVPVRLQQEQPTLVARIVQRWGKETLGDELLAFLTADQQTATPLSAAAAQELMRISIVYADLCAKQQALWASEREQANTQTYADGYLRQRQHMKAVAAYTPTIYHDGPATVMPQEQDLVRWSPLMQASFMGRLTEVERLLDIQQGLGLGETDADGYQALHLAAMQGHAEVARALLAAGAEVDPPSRRLSRPLLLAAAAGYLSVVEVLLDFGAEVALCKHDGRTALHQAAANGHEAVVLRLLQAGADVLQEDQRGQNALMLVPQNKPRLYELLQQARPGQPQARPPVLVFQPWIDWGH
ncbi:ankyrin repeat domain-containing protein [Chitinibacter tainanensis]|uniref:ankyrin repeat domain-containing protein n=1 Tax=Chitinibacter tainanensis TaxID=230667 RepID=UPI002355DFAC|nr:ankyrin repeat domain-containing protein [Chitinibacter tainanensis]